MDGIHGRSRNDLLPFVKNLLKTLYRLCLFLYLHHKETGSGRRAAMVIRECV